jgi:hypothetical protein
VSTTLTAPAGGVGARLGQTGPRLLFIAGRLESLGPRFAVPSLVVLSAVLMVPDWASQVREAAWFGTNGDGGYFAGKGAILLGPHALDVYSDRTLQSGPWQLLVWRALTVMGGERGSLLAGIVAVALAAVAVFVVVRHLLAGRPLRNVLAFAVAAVLLLWGPITESYDSGHLAQVAIPLMWLMAAQLARTGRPVPAGLLLGLTAGVETWGVLGAALVLMLPTLRQRAVASGIAAGVAVATYLPFVLGGSFHMFAMHWNVTNETLVHFLVPVGTPFTYQLRLVQVLAAGLVSAGVVLVTRRNDVSVWAVVAVPVAVRLVLDAQVYDYYLVPLRVAGLVAVSLLLADRRGRPAVVMLAATAVTFTDGLWTCWLPIAVFGLVATAVAVQDTRIGERSMLHSSDLFDPEAQGLVLGAENH